MCFPCTDNVSCDGSRESAVKNKPPVAVGEATSCTEVNRQNALFLSIFIYAVLL